MKVDPKYLPIEAPDAEGLVDFISAHVVVRLTVVDGTLKLNVCASHGEGSSTWDEHGFEVTLPKVEPPEPDEAD